MPTARTISPSWAATSAAFFTSAGMVASCVASAAGGGDGSAGGFSAGGDGELQASATSAAAAIRSVHLRGERAGAVGMGTGGQVLFLEGLALLGGGAVHLVDPVAVGPVVGLLRVLPVLLGVTG